MKKTPFFLFFLFLIIASCESGNNFENTEVIETDFVETIKTPNAAMTSFPLLGNPAANDYVLEQEHKYGGGDCFGDIWLYASGNDMLTIDSMSCGDYGFTTTRYMVANEELKMVYRVKVEITRNLWTETIYDFRIEPFCIYERSGSMMTDDLAAAYANSPSKEDLVDAAAASEELMDAYLGLFDKKLEEE